MKTKLLLAAGLLLALFLPSARAADGDRDSDFPAYANDFVAALALQADGKILVGGMFTSIASVSRGQIARLNADGTLDTGFSPMANNFVYSIALQADGKMILGGMFTSVGGAARSRIARINADGSLDSDFNPMASNTVYSVVLQADGKILIGGGFTGVAGSPRNRLARLNPDGSLDSSFNPNANSYVRSVAVQTDGAILLGGEFTTVGGLGRNRIVRINADGSLDASFNPDANGTVYSVAVQADGKILLGGAFTTLGGTTRNHIARLNPDGTLDASFTPNVNNLIYSLAVQVDGMILLGGYLTSVAGTTRNYIARLNSNGSLDMGFDPNANSSVDGVALQADGKVLLGGDFTTLGGSVTTHSRIARLLNGTSTQSLTLSNGTSAQWLRGGTAPDVESTTLDLSTDGGSNWIPLGSGIRILGGWAWPGLSLPGNGAIRAQGRTKGGMQNGSSGLVGSLLRFGPGSYSQPVPLCKNVTVVTDASGTAAASIDNGSYDSDGDTITLAQTPPGPYSPGTNLVTLTVTDNQGNSNSCSATVTVIRYGQTSSLIPTGSVWKYLDTGVNAGTAWKETNFNDSAWASGPAQLGYGDGDEATVVSYGPSSTSKYITTYFRRSFHMPDTSFITNLAVRLQRDDGAVVYLNGVEVYRSNMPGGTVGYQTLASSTEPTADENSFHVRAVPAPLLHPGTNFLAVEVHQSDVTSSDLSFDLELIANSALGRTADPLPPPWVNLDVGGPGVRGSASYVTNMPVWMVQGGGVNIYNTSDQFHFVYQSVTGDCEIKARVAAMGESKDVAKGGVMIRETLSAGSKHALMNLTPEYGAEFIQRSTTGGSATYLTQSGVTAPYWVKMVRAGTTLTGSTSPDGTNWTQVSAQTISMSNAVYVGLAVSSLDNTKLNMVAFDQVNGLGSGWAHQDIGSPGLTGSVFIQTNAPTFLVQGGGPDLYDFVDHFHYVAQPVTGDCAFQARVAAQGNTAAWAKSGVMMRESFASGSKHILMAMTPEHGAQCVVRSTTGGSSSDAVLAGLTAPYWVRLIRSGNQFTAFASSNGVAWTLVRSATISMNDTIYVGLAMSSLVTSVTGEAAFDSVDFVPVVNSLTAVDGDLFFQGDPIELHADATDRDGQVTQVNYYLQGTNFIGAASLPPYAFVWTNAPPGMNYVSARAVDDRGVEGAPLHHSVFMAEPDTYVTFFSEFLSTNGLILQGDAAVTNGILRASKGQSYSLGGAWLDHRVYVASGFDTTFQFQISSVNNNADGFALVLFGAPQPVLGLRGGLGYGNLTNSLAVEFDTYWNPDNGDPNGRHIGVHTRGTLANTDNESAAIGRATNPLNFLDGNIHTAKITYVNDVFTVFLDDLTTPIISLNLSLSNTLNLTEDAAWIGFTGSGGDYYENHDILNWAFVTTNLHPIVSLTTPTNGAVFLPTDSLILNATATDLDGTIQQVVFFVDGNYVGNATQSPWQLPVGALSAGPHTLSAAALDDTDAVTVSALVTIIVNTPPVAQCRDLTVPADATCTALANIDAGSSDVDPGDTIKLVQTPPGPYPLGSTVVTLTATDTYGASNSCAATVTVVDTTPPTITCLANFKVATAPGSCFSNVTFTVTGSDLCGAVNVLCVPPSGSAFAVGATLVNCTATDVASNAANCTFTVTVNDPEPPQITCPSDLAVSTAPGSCASNVVFTAAATDNCGTVNVLCVPPSGSAFAVGTNLVNCSATDGASNTATCAFNVNVNDPEPPQITCPTNLVVAADTGQCSKSNVTWTATATDNCAVTNVACEPVSGATFAVGTNLVTCIATDASGNTASCNFTVTVLDAELPQITCPANLVVNPTIGGNTMTVAFAATATDNCDPSPAIVCAPPSGAEFPIGTTPVECVATDTAGNTNSCRFSIRVNAPPEVSLVVPTNNATFPLAQPISLLADASDPDGDGVPRVDFFAGTNLLGTATSGYLFVWTNAPVGLHSLTARATDGLGAETTSSAVQISVLAQPPITYAPVTSSNLNRQTGLYVQPVRITNPTASAFDALRLWVALDTNSLAHNVRLWNATGTSNGIPFVLASAPLPAGGSVVLNLEYYIPDRRTMPNPVFTVELISASAPPDPAGMVLEVDRASRLADGTFWVEFSTLSNRVYYLQYSGDVSAWKTALPAVPGTGRRVSWRDAGPPKTESAPQSATNRFYRIIRLP